MKKERKGLIHNSFFVRNQREEKLSALFGMDQGTDMDMYDYEFDEKSQLTIIHSENTGKTVTLGSVFPSAEIADEVISHLAERGEKNNKSIVVN